MKSWLSKSWKENRTFIFFLVLMFVFRSTFADWNTVPTGSMKPTILIGDRILVNKMAYDIHFPFSHFSMIKMGDPERGDIIVFDSKVSDKRLVKRVIGMPGDLLALDNNLLTINGKALSYENISNDGVRSDKFEDLEGVSHIVRVNNTGSYLSSFDPVRVPEGHYLAMGDNRDNSADSRVIGFVPRGEIVGRSSTVVLSFNYDNYYIPRAGRYLQAL
ncbi:MAG: signal peptidase I [Candidatus Azotimanducaceae bacterium]|jgi:signal peptidase I